MAIPRRAEPPIASLTLVAAVLVLLLAGCSSLPQDVTEAARGQRQSLDAGDALIEQKRAEYSASLSGSEYASLAIYAERENLLARFDAAQRELLGLRIGLLVELEQPGKQGFVGRGRLAMGQLAQAGDVVGDRLGDEAQPQAVGDLAVVAQVVGDLHDHVVALRQDDRLHLFSLLDDL